MLLLLLCGYIVLILDYFSNVLKGRTLTLLSNSIEGDFTERMLSIFLRSMCTLVLAAYAQ